MAEPDFTLACRLMQGIADDAARPGGAAFASNGFTISGTHSSILPMSTSRTAVHDRALTATVVTRTPLFYVDGADPALDRPAHVRAGSSLAWVPGGIALIQDDANFVALVEPSDGRARAITLPAGVGGRRQFDDDRGNKAHKFDLEACVAVEREGETLLLALGSGSSSRRERVAMIRDWERDDPDVSFVHVPRLYDVLRETRRFAGPELNVEGAVFLADRLRLFGRGNGASRDGEAAANATCDLDWATLLEHLDAPDRHPPPRPDAVMRYDLGDLDGVALGFTDAARWGDGLLYSAAAEDSPDAVQDGRVTGSVLGVIASDGRTRWAALAEASGATFTGKVEGVLPTPDAADRVYVVVDADDPDEPSALCTVELRGPWHA